MLRSNEKTRPGNRRRHLAIMGIVLTMLAGCVTVGPDYRQPDLSVPAAWNNETGEENVAGTADKWWSTLNDPALSSLIERAVAGNLDLKKARARVREARAQRGVAQAGYFPTLGATGTATRSRSSEETGSGETGVLYSAGFDAGWELDVFGGVRRSVEAADATLQATQESLHDVLVTLLAEVALNYTEVRTWQARIAAAEANLKSQEETFQLTSWRQQAGLSDDLAVRQARYNLESTRSQLPTLRTGLEEARNRIAVLLGEQPGKVHAELEERKPIPVASAGIALGVPAEALRNRPDVRKAERELAAQTAKIGVATADLYPKFKLNGSIGVDSTLIGRLFTSGTYSWSFGPQITWTIFDGGAIRRNIEAQTALQEQYWIAYEAAALGALEEAENAIRAYVEEQIRRRSLSEATQAAEEAARLARLKYQAGLADFSSVLEAQRSLLAFQDSLAQSEGAITSNLIKLYKALGGGWTSLVPDGTKTPESGESK
ncbi:MAG: RND transporter [Deltaproteobacteria bacterium HGW-Deltaproteobacteria-19]|jgi:NodT family efflux transporter outer membrane factor (OMF) lipoprotein|nr:MAG: RND transporter [Deltaproteobacteria bacterium HGW-Deltaproteobacteria-19]